MTAVCVCLNSPCMSYCFGMERVTSHIEEQFIGRYRNHFNGFYTPLNAFNFAVRAPIALDFEHDLNVNFTIPKRDNFLDSKGNTYDKYSPLSDEFQLNIEEFTNDLFLAGTGQNQQLNEHSIFSLNVVNDFFQKFQSPLSESLSLSKGSGIVPRIIDSTLDTSELNEFHNQIIAEEEKASDSLYKNLINKKII